MRDLNANDFLYILLAARWTIALSLIAITSGGLLGLGIMLARLARSRVIRGVSMAYIQFFQATPLLMQLFLVFFGGTLIGIRFDPWTAALIAFSLHSSAFLGDIWHGCMLSVPRSQWDAARSLALPNWITLRLVIAPQAGRIAVAPTIGFLVQLIKGTSLASIIGFTELVRAGQFITNSTLQPLFVYGFVACLFYMICWPLSKLSQSVELRLNRGFQRS
ncbi:MAG: amino acid ABC transporter permease [Proteobacteria bacterium]|nr:amino acid ABC transporter permease [Pseudomonadota bacterium]